MDDLSIFQDKANVPTDRDLADKLGSTYNLWIQIKEFVFEKYPKAIAEWNYSGIKYGWNFRIKDKKRAIIYFLPRDNYFKVAFVFGQKATDFILESEISPEIKNDLEQATKYAEGRGIRIDVKDNLILTDIKKLIEIKLAN
ncbi:MAG: DUF3788 domain-containing protein [Prolixibacteraceae bacterium]|nr:DUF3788 domain-containing protein [Prolixibacteraceae bacterium]